MFTLVIDNRVNYGIFRTWVDAVYIGMTLLDPAGVSWDWRLR